MADSMRWRYGDTKPTLMPVDADTVIEIGDLVWLDTDDIKPAAEVPDQGTEAANQEYFHDRFAGVAMQRSPAGESTAIRVATAGVFEFVTPIATYEVGALIGVDEASNGTQLNSQQVAEVATPNLAVGRCAQRLNPASTRVLVDVVSTVMLGGPQAAA